MNTKQIEQRIARRRNVLKENLLKEGITQSIASDIVQFLASAAVEYGIDIGTAGTGIAGGSAAETFIDALFASKSIEDSILSIKDIASQEKQFVDILKRIMGLSSSLKSGSEKFYSDINSLLSDFFKLSGEEVETNVETQKEKLKMSIEKLIDKFVDSAVKGVKVLIPDAAVGLAVGTALRTALKELSSNPYTNGIKALDASKNLKEFIIQPGVASKFFNELGKQLILLMKKASVKIKEQSWLKTVAVSLSIPVAAPQILTLKSAGPTGLKELARLTEENLPNLVKICDKIVEVVIPGLFACLAAYQSLENEDWKTSQKEQKQDESVLIDFVKSVL
jgi:hypothetical protein